ncbi:MAG: hypothetical protein KAS72_10070 [Phycisphaerales bacterium]|nr:hypothetical protein [Phycisphaerales bacterium]
MTGTSAHPHNDPDRNLALRVMTLPKDTNQYGTIFGGVILSYIDQAGFVEARRHGVHRWVTAAMTHVDFKASVQLGDLISFYTHTLRTGTTSVRVEVEVEVSRHETDKRELVTTAELVMVSVDCDGKPIPFHEEDPTLC